MDVGDADSVAAAVELAREAFGDMSVLVNNAGANRVVGPSWTADHVAWWDDVRVNLLGPFLCSAAVVPSMIARGGGRIINIVSRSGGKTHPFNTAYASSKAGLVRYSDCLAAEVEPFGIAVFALNPGLVRTELTVGVQNADAEHQWLGGAIDETHLVEPEVAAAATVLLASGQCDALSGRWLDVAEDIPNQALRAAEIKSADLLQMRRLTMAERR